MSRLLNVILTLALLTLGVYHVHAIHTFEDSDRLIDLDDRAVPLPQGAEEILYYRGIYPYRNGVLTADGYRIFEIGCDLADGMCADTRGEVIASIQEAAAQLPLVQRQHIVEGKVVCIEYICKDFRNRVVGSAPR